MDRHGGLWDSPEEGLSLQTLCLQNPYVGFFNNPLIREGSHKERR